MLNPCSSRIDTSAAVAPVAQGTPASLHVSRIRSRFACTFRVSRIALVPHGDRHIPRAGPDRANPLDFPQYILQVLHPVRLFHYPDEKHIAIRVQRPEVGGIVVFRRSQTPVARGNTIPPTPFALRLEVGGAGNLGIARRNHCRLRVLHRVEVGQHQSVNAGVQRLLQYPLVLLAKVGRNPYKRSRVGLQGTPVGYLLALDSRNCSDILSLSKLKSWCSISMMVMS